MRNEKTLSIFLSSGRKEKSERSFRRIRGAFTAGSLVALAALMTGCGDVPDAINPGHWWDSTFGDDEDQAAPPEKSAGKPATAAASAPSGTQTAQAAAGTAPALPASQTPPQTASGQQPYPKIQDVPQKPETSTLEERRKVMEGLAADKANAHYTDDAARAAAAATAAPAAPAPAPATSNFALSPDLAAPPTQMAQAEPAAPPTPPPSPPAAAPSASGGHKKTYVSGLDTGPVAPPPAPPVAPDASMPAAPSAASTSAAPSSAEAVTPPAQGSAELDQIYASKLQESAPTVTTAPVGPTSAVAGANTAAIAEPAEKPTKGKHGKASKASNKAIGSGAPSPGSNPSVQVFDSGYDGGYSGTYQAAYNEGNDGFDGAGMLPGQVGTIYFSNGSAQISESDRAKLSQVVAQYKERGGMIRVVGHASSFTRDMDPSQHDMVNYKISSRRADAVAQALMKLGVGAENISVTAEADHDPVYYEVMPAGEAGNRRVEIFIDY